MNRLFTTPSNENDRTKPKKKSKDRNDNKDEVVLFVDDTESESVSAQSKRVNPTKLGQKNDKSKFNSPKVLPKRGSDNVWFYNLPKI